MKIQNILIATDSFKGSLSAIDVTRYIEEGLKRYRPSFDIVKIPVADGGEGTVDSILFATGGALRTVPVTGPLGDTVQASYGILPNGSAALEMAAASGLTLLEESRRNPWKTSTSGTGQLMKAALDEGCTQMLIGIGGSATNDGGAGMAQALGVRFLDKWGRELPPGGGALQELDRIDVSCLDKRVENCDITIACDVSNPLCGINGASHIYGPQKGADTEMILQLDRALARYAEIIKRDLGKDIRDIPGAGAAGGLGAGLLAFCNANMRSGIQSVLDMMGFDAIMEHVDLVITGEGSIDHQTLYGKVPDGVAKRAKALRGVPVIAVCGTLGKDYESVYGCGIDLMFSIANGPISLENCMKSAPQLLMEAGLHLGHLIEMMERY